MIELKLQDDSANDFSLNGATIEEPARGSLTSGGESFEFEQTIVERSSEDGSVALGRRRIRSRELTLRLSRAPGTEISFRSKQNALLEFLKRATRLVDVTHSLLVPISVLSHKIIYDEGALKLSSDDEIVLRMLAPHWRALVADHYEDTDPLIVGVNTIPLTNSGSVATPPKFVVIADDPLVTLQVYVDETKEGIQVDDPLLGTVGYETMTIDCEAGTAELGGFDRTQHILPGTGFFELPVGASTLKVVTTATCFLEIDFYKRYHL